MPALILLGLMAAAVLFVLRSTEPAEPPVSVFPLPERYAESYSNDWGAARVQGDHEGRTYPRRRGHRYVPLRPVP